MTESTYTQADLDAAVAAALEGAAECVQLMSGSPRMSSQWRWGCFHAAYKIGKLRPDASATLEARDRAKVAEGMRRAADIAFGMARTVEHPDEELGLTLRGRRMLDPAKVADAIRAEAEKMERGEG